MSDEFARGYLLAVANIMHLHGEDTIASDVLAESGVTKAAMERLGFDTYDVKRLRPLYARLAEQRRNSERRHRERLATLKDTPAS